MQEPKFPNSLAKLAWYGINILEYSSDIFIIEYRWRHPVTRATIWSKAGFHKVQNDMQECIEAVIDEVLAARDFLEDDATWTNWE